jgi:hypothetical protein
MLFTREARVAVPLTVLWLLLSEQLRLPLSAVQALWLSTSPLLAPRLLLILTVLEAAHPRVLSDSPQVVLLARSVLQAAHCPQRALAP